LAVRFIKEELSGMDKVLTGYVLRNPKDGWLYIRGLLVKPENSLLQRIAALRVLRYLHKTRPDVIGKQALVEAMKRMLNQTDVADLVVDELRRWRCWDLADHILPLYGKREYAFPIIRRAILLYAADCPRPEAAAFVREHRKLKTEDEKLIQ
jgi:hypothetical protein